MTNPLQFTRAALRTLVEKGGFDRILDKVTIISAEAGKAKAEVKVSRDISNRFGTAHGGAIATLVDSISTMALMTHDLDRPLPGVSLDLSVQYLSAIPEGSTIVIEAETMKKGQSLAYLSVNIMDKETQKLLARGSHVKFIAKPNL